MISRAKRVVDRLFAQRKVKSCSFVSLTFAEDAAIVALDNPSDKRKTHPGSLELTWSMEPMEGHEQRIRLVHVKAHTIVTDEVDRFTGGLRKTNFDLRFLARPSEFESVRQQVAKHLPEQSRIRVTRR